MLLAEPNGNERAHHRNRASCFFSLLNMSSRLSREYRQILRQLTADNGSEDDRIVLFPKQEEDLFSWTAFIQGPAETPYEGGLFELHLSVASTYPVTPPKISFKTKVFHPNVHFKVIWLLLSTYLPWKLTSVV